MHEEQESHKPTEATSGLNDGLGGCRLIDVSLRVVNTIENMDSEIQLLFTFTDNAVTKFGDETVEVMANKTRECFIRLHYGADMRDVALGLTRLAGHIATVTTPRGTA